MSILLECKNVTKKYGDTIALSHFNLELTSGKIIGLLGPNGSGKTTLMKLINSLLVLDEGSITINGIQPCEKTKAIVSYLPDKSVYPAWMKIHQLINFYKDFYKDFKEERAQDMLKSLNIDKNTKFASLSKGNKEKVALILTLSRDAKLYCLDEPIGGVDPATRDYIVETILSNYNKDASILISTHIISDLEKILDEVVVLKEGSLIMHKDVDDIRQENNKSIDQIFREEFKC